MIIDFKNTILIKSMNLNASKLLDFRKYDFKEVKFDSYF